MSSEKQRDVFEGTRNLDEGVHDDTLPNIGDDLTSHLARLFLDEGFEGPDNLGDFEARFLKPEVLDITAQYAQKIDIAADKIVSKRHMQDIEEKTKEKENVVRQNGGIHLGDVVALQTALADEERGFDAIESERKNLLRGIKEAEKQYLRHQILRHICETLLPHSAGACFDLATQNPNSHYRAGDKGVIAAYNAFFEAAHLPTISETSPRYKWRIRPSLDEAAIAAAGAILKHSGHALAPGKRGAAQGYVM